MVVFGQAMCHITIIELIYIELYICISSYNHVGLLLFAVRIFIILIIIIATVCNITANTNSNRCCYYYCYSLGVIVIFYGPACNCE